MDERVRKEIGRCLRAEFGERLIGVALYGSEAREQAGPDSDIDLLVLVRGSVQLWEDIGAAVKALYDLQLELERPIHALPASADDFENEKYELYSRIKEEGVWL